MSVVYQEQYRSNVFNTQDVYLNEDNFDFGLRIASYYPGFDPNEKIE